MGQYYVCVNIDKGEFLNPRDYDNGMKITEHSWIGNNFLLAVEELLTGRWKNGRIVWAGDYMNDYILLGKSVKRTAILDAAKKGIRLNLHTFARDHFRNLSYIKGSDDGDFGYRYLINHSRKEYVDKKRQLDDSGWTLHPLSLLTCSGNGRGGGDYHGTAMEYVGTWAGDPIEVSDQVPDIEEYTEINPGFEERR